ncbi:MAG: hypothetical protein U9Q72_01500 [Patescibacteria group bacterium]|nr:hypothetical protein [Patescibacteria group bacterium]
MDDPRKLPQEEIPKNMENKEDGKAETIKENLQSSNNPEKVVVENDLEQKPSIPEKPAEVEKVAENQALEKERSKEALGKQVESGGGLAQEGQASQEIARKNEGVAVEIKNLVKLAVRGAKEEKETVAKAKELFKKDPHSLDNFHDQLIEEKQKGQ